MYNYHTHTKRCNHAIGNDEEYIKAAIEAGYEGIGFTDHIMLPGISASHVRADFEVKDEYVSTIRKLQKKYRYKIDIYLGFECEWDKKYEKYYQSLLDNKEVDYLIFGNHGIYFKNGERFLKINSHSQYLQRYLKYALKGIRSGLFKIMAHPDIFMSSVPWNEQTKKVSEMICKEAKKYNVALEINCGCLINESKRELFKEERYRYPYKEFWKIAKRVGNTIVVGIDAHSPKALLSENKKLAYNFAKELHLKITDKLDIENVTRRKSRCQMNKK